MRYIIAGVIAQGVINALLSGKMSLSDSMQFNAIAFVLAALGANAARWVNRKNDSTRPIIGTRDVLVLNLVTALTFLSFYSALVWVPASVAGGEAGIAPIAALLLAGFGGPLRNWVVPLALLAASVAFGLAQYETAGGGRAYFPVGVVLAALAGCGMATIAAISRRLGARGVQAIDVLAVRYHLTYLVAATAAVPLALSNGSGLGWGMLVWYALGGVVAPLWLYQKGMEVTSPVRTMGLIALVPVVSFGTEWLQGRPVTPVSAGLVVLVVALAILAARLKSPAVEA